MSVRFLPEAFDELQQAISYLNHDQTGAGNRFEAAFWKAVDSIAHSPDAWQRVTPRARRKIIRRFRYGVIYTIARGEVVIVAVMHLHRKPGYWRGRLT